MSKPVSKAAFARLVILVSGFAAMVACGTGTGNVAIRLVRLTSTPVGPAPDPGAPIPLPAPTISPLALGSNVSLESLKIPVRAIELVGDELTSEIYYCDADTNDGCLVELNRDPGIDVLGGRQVSVDPGTYTQLLIRTCVDASSYTLRIKGTADIEASTYVTQADGVPVINSSAQDTLIQVSNCQYTVPLPAPITVDPGSSTSLGLYYDIRNMVWMGLRSAVQASPEPAPWNSTGCSGNSGGIYNPAASAFVCAQFPILQVQAGGGEPVLERYLINNRAVLGIYFKSSDYSVGTKTPIGGYLRRYYGTETPAGSSFGFDVLLKKITKNLDGSYSLETYGASATGSPYFRSIDFPGSLNTTDTIAGTGTFTGLLSGTRVNDFVTIRLE